MVNRLPTTKNQLRLYEELDKQGVDYVLIGGLASRFYGRARMTTDIDILVKGDEENFKRVLETLGKLGFDCGDVRSRYINEYVLFQFKEPFLLDVHVRFGDISYGDVGMKWFEYEGVGIKVIDKEGLMRLLSVYKYGGQDLRVLRMLDSPEENEEELKNNR